MIFRLLFIVCLSMLVVAQNCYSAEMWSLEDSGKTIEMTASSTIDSVKTEPDNGGEISLEESIGDTSVGHHYRHGGRSHVGAWLVVWGITGICAGVVLLLGF